MWARLTWPNISFPDGDNYKELFGALDNAFLVAYAIGMFIRYTGALHPLPSAHQFAPVCQETGFHRDGVMLMGKQPGAGIHLGFGHWFCDNAHRRHHP